MKFKYALLPMIFSALFFLSCENDPVNSNEDEKYLIFDSDRCVVPNRIQYGKDKIYHYKIALETNYLKQDSLKITSFLITENDSVEIELYDDGVSDDSLRNDLAASNNVWSGGINAIDITTEGVWLLKVNVYIDNSIKITEQIFSDIFVKENTAPQITAVTGLVQNDTLESGFETRNITVSINDPDNDAAGYNDNQTLKLEIRNRDNVPKDYEFDRPDPLNNMFIQLDSTLAAGLKTNSRYTMTFIATDYYGESDSIKFDYIRIENTAPSLYNLNKPDTVFVPADSTLFVDFSVLVNLNDPQGNLESQDIQEVLITTGSPRPMRDDGEELDAVKDDGIYTISFSVSSSFFSGTQAELPFTIQAMDKAGNPSGVLSGVLLFVEKEFKNTKRSTDESHFIYINPFN
jgi:hypothetical protein